MTVSAEQPALSSASPNLFLRLSHALLDLLFPARCVGCGRVGAAWCQSCALALAVLPLTSHLRTLEGIQIASSGPHESLLQEAIQGLKYEGVRALAAPFGERIAALVRAAGWQADLVIAVPSHRSRERARGYNQAQLIAAEVAHRLDLPCVPRAMQRTRATRSQVGLTRTERQANVQAAFTASPEAVEGRRVLLVDDVCTTGATLVECAQALLWAGAHDVRAVTVSYAVHP